jgi:hypothetical protein
MMQGSKEYIGHNGKLAASPVRLLDYQVADE